MNDDEWTSVIPQTIISLGKNMEMDVIAEGVETIEQLFSERQLAELALLKKIIKKQKRLSLKPFSYNLE